MIVLALLAMLIGMPILAVTAPAPAANPVDGATAQMDVPFALDFFNFRIQKIEWIANGTPLFQKMGLSTDEGYGTLVITAAIKANRSNSDNVPTSNVQAIFKDGSTSTQEPMNPFATSGRPSNGTYQAGDGGTLLFVLVDMPEPTADNPITKIVFRQTYDNLKPALIRLLNPPVSIVR
jgi:hypothetical protein